MKQLQDMTVMEEILSHKIIAIIRGFSQEQILHTAEALLKGGIRLMEVTFDYAGDPSATPQAIRALCRAFGSEMLFGAGTVLTPGDAEAACEAGARYIITPNTDTSVIRRTKELGLVSMPGAMTPSEAVTAYRAGADIVKIFPSGDLGPGYIKALRGPLGFIPMAAVGGVDEHNIASFFAAGACCAGVGGKLADRASVRSGDYAAVTQAAKRLLSAAGVEGAETSQ